MAEWKQIRIQTQPKKQGIVLENFPLALAKTEKNRLTRLGTVFKRSMLNWYLCLSAKASDTKKIPKYFKFFDFPVTEN